VSKQRIVRAFRPSALVIALLIAVPAAAQAEMPSPVLVVGDSLAVGMRP